MFIEDINMKMTPKEFYEHILIRNYEEFIDKLLDSDQDDWEVKRTAFNACISAHSMADHILFYFKECSFYLPESTEKIIFNKDTNLSKKWSSLKTVGIASNSCKHLKRIKGTKAQRDQYLSGENSKIECSAGAIAIARYLDIPNKLLISINNNEEKISEEKDLGSALNEVVNGWKIILSQLESEN
jgi:hypothetical protein